MKITEQQANLFFYTMTHGACNGSWNSFNKGLKDYFGIYVRNENPARLDFLLATLAQEFQAVYNLFNEERSESLRENFIETLDNIYGKRRVLFVKTRDSYAIDSFAEYDEAFQDTTEENNETNLFVIPELLTIKLLRNSSYDRERVKDMSLYLVLFCQKLLGAGVSGIWKIISENCEFTEDDTNVDLEKVYEKLEKLLQEYNEQETKDRQQS